ncbi:MAG: ATP-binding protein [Anaeromicrobium sp.]|jgi:hypothetical protein|uniref:HD domain-containing protein n=1 Tax=Anaeromicrobium sp. TaxID=1929132 RepID=UPI0025FAB8E5|nr:ATP-binding protein [Anaeromicrobium sp.]MCT4594201.1 ATP-binding protein [Anaeromicrobium sp.]
MKEIKIPKVFDEKLKSGYKGDILVIFDKYKNFLLEQMPLFAEYTDHSNEHIQYVLDTGEKLITKECWKVLTSEDIFVLLLAILFHDLGMHISIEGFKTLLRSGNIIESYDTKSWKEEWEKYINEVSKYDEEKQRRFFNQSYMNIKDKQEFETLGENEKELIGEFIRRQHGRLAHEIAIYGFPVRDDNFENYNEKKYIHLYDLAGFIARSHSMDLRETYPYLQDKYFDVWKRPYKVHVMFLMVVLRVSDYLHITNDRVNPYKFKLIKFKNEMSILEFKKHLSVYDIQQVIDNPENLFVTCNPNELKTYLSMENLINSIQNELDNSWAVLGEVYGISKLGIAIRRIDSNIFKKQWLDKSTYVTEDITFKLDSRLKNLLIEPLYGDNPSYGVRELIQNAVDACKSRKNRSSKIDIELEGDYLIIKDNGIGMDIDIIKNYFLSIGSPFVESSQWKEVNNDKDIVRNGRFGIGILSSFLLGDKIEVTTYKKSDKRNKNEKYGYVFKIVKTVSEIPIYKKKYEELENIISDGSGTQVKILLKEEVKKSLINNNIIIDQWYKMSDVDFQINIQNYNEDSNKINFEEENWKELYCNEFNKVRWTYDYKIDPLKWKSEKSEEYSSVLSPNLICNGIIIPEKYDLNLENVFIKNWPIIHIDDMSGSLELDLSRFKVTKPLPFLKELEEQLLEDFFQELNEMKVLNTKTNRITLKEIVTNNFKTQELMFFKDGYTLYNDYIIEKMNPKWVVEIWDTSLNVDWLEENVAYILHGYRSHPNLKYELYERKIRNTNIYIPSYNYNVYMNDGSSYYKFRNDYKDRIKYSSKEMQIKDYAVIKTCENLLMKEKLELYKNQIPLIIEESFSNFKANTCKREKEIIDKYINKNYLYPYNNSKQVLSSISVVG